MNGWTRVRLRRVFESVVGGNWGEDADDSEFCLPCIRAADFDYRTLRVDLERAPRRAYSAHEIRTRAARPGDLILEKSGGGEHLPVGRAVLWDGQGMVMPTNFAARMVVADGYEPRLVTYLLAAHFDRGVTWATLKQTTGLQNLDVGAYLDTEASLPDRPNQTAIADFLDTETARIDALVNAKRTMKELFTSRFESAIFSGVTRGLRGSELKPSGLSWIAEIPRDWGVPRVSANFELQLGKMLNAEAADGPQQFPYLRNTNVQWDRFDLDDLATMHFDTADRARCSLRADDLLVCEGGEVGRAAVWSGEPSDCHFQKAIHRVRPRNRANSRYLMYCLRAAAKRNVFAVEGNTSTFVHLTGEQLRVHRFPWPPDDEQEEIVEALDELRDVTGQAEDTLTRQIALLQERKQALITAAVTGQLAIPGTAA